MSANESNDETVGARWIATADGPPLQHAALRIIDGVITEVISNGQAKAKRDLGDVLMTPRWINAHTHLEFSHLEKPLGSPGMAITDWIPLVIGDRIKNASTAVDSIRQGMAEAVASGTIALGEIATQPWYRDLSDQVQLHSLMVTAFVERLGNQPGQNSTKIAEAKDWLDFELPFGPNSRLNLWHGGLSPHAPYSTNFDLFLDVIQLAASARLPVAMHLAESKEELQFLKKGSGPFSELLESLHAMPPQWQARQILDYLQAMTQTKRSLIVHGNYLTAAELDFIAKHDSLHVIFCPRTHNFFQHEPYPLAEIRKRGINLAVGTDSRASNPDLNVLLELREIADQFPAVPSEEILRIGTLNGAKALGIESTVGSLSVGKRAQFLTFPTNDDAQPLEPLFHRCQR